MAELCSAIRITRSASGCLYSACATAQGREQEHTEDQAGNQAADMCLPAEACIVDVKGNVEQQPEEPVDNQGIASGPQRAPIDDKESAQSAKDARDSSGGSYSNFSRGEKVEHEAANDT